MWTELLVMWNPESPDVHCTALNIAQIHVLV